MGSPFQTGLKKFKLFNHLYQTHEIFGEGKYCERIKFDKIWEYQNKEFPFKRGRQNFYTFKSLKLDKSNYRSG